MLFLFINIFEMVFFGLVIWYMFPILKWYYKDIRKTFKE